MRFFYKLLFCFCSWPVWTQEQKLPIVIKIEDLPKLIFARNYDVQIAKKNVLLAQYEKNAANAPFDWNFYSSLAQEEKISNPNSSFDQRRIKEQTSSFSLGSTRDFFYGTKVDFSLQLLHIKSDSLIAVSPKRYQSAAKLKIDQPLLNGFGPAIIGEKLLKSDPKINRYEAQLNSVFGEQLKKAIDSFWEIYALEQEIKLQVNNLTKLRFILDYAVNSHAVGIKGRIDILEAKSSLIREEALFQKKQGDKFQKILKLLAIINYPTERITEDIDQRIVLKFDSNTPFEELIKQNKIEEISFKISEEKFRLEELMVDLKQKKNKLMPKLDLQFEMTSPGLSRSKSETLKQSSEYQYNNYKIALNFVWAMENLTSEGDYHKAYESNTQQQLKINKDVLNDTKSILQKEEELRVCEINGISLISRQKMSWQTVEVEKSLMIQGKKSMLDYLEELENWLLTEQEVIDHSLKKQTLNNHINYIKGNYSLSTFHL